MITTRIATAATTQIDGTAMTGTAGPAIEDADTIPHELEAATRGPNVTNEQHIGH